MVKSQLKTFTPVGIEITMVMMPKKAFTFAPAPIVKKWCSHTINEKTVMARIAHTMDVYPKIRFLENVATTSEKIPKAGKIKIYTSGWPQAQMRLKYIID